MTMLPKEWWGNPDNAEVWLRRERTRATTREHLSLQEDVLSDFEEDKDRFGSVLEFGAGNGRLIGALHQRYPDKLCGSLDINPKLSEYVGRTYGIKSYVGELINPGLESKSFDLVFTYQVLQHCHPSEIDRAMWELKRIARKELWLYEGWIDFAATGTEHGQVRCTADGGTFNWNFRKFKPYFTKLHWKSSKEKYCGIMLYKIKVD